MNEKKSITEENNRTDIDAWFEEAKGITPETLPEFIRKLTEDYRHDYGTIRHAVAAGAIAGASAVNRSPAGGITGFQAGAVLWEFMRAWRPIPKDNIGMSIVDYDNLLYPQYADHFENTINPKTADALRLRAEKMLEEKDIENVHPDVVTHWKFLAGGNLPFGFRIKEDR